MTGRDEARPVATTDDYISIKEAHAIFTAHGRAITERTLQRYCEKQHLESQKLLTAEGEKWFVRKSSVHRKLSELKEFDRLRTARQDAASRDTSRPVGEENQGVPEHDSLRQPTTPETSAPVIAAAQSQSSPFDEPRQDAASRDGTRAPETAEPQTPGMSNAERELYERLVAQLVEQKSELVKDKEALLRQLEAKDRQIDRFFESERETKTLTGRLQSLMSALWPKKGEESGERYVPMHEALESGLDRNPGEDR